MRTRSKLALTLVALAVLAVAATYTAYTRDLDAARARIAAASTLAHTPCGAIEYAELGGKGPAVLVVHGAGGGYDQLLDLARTLAAQGYRAVAMSRFGYLGTPMPADPMHATPEAQADAHACLLDALGIARAALIGVSAGGPSSLQFAIRHPQRTTGLFLIVPLAWSPSYSAAPPSPTAAFVFEHVLEWDFAYWLMLKTAPRLLVTTMLGTPYEVYRAADAREQTRAHKLLEDTLPLSARAAGLANEARIAQGLARYRLESIRAPSVTLSLEDDLYRTYAGARYTAEQIPGARFVGFASGGHLFLGHEAEVMRELGTFLRGLD